ncbi:hypothetical protein [Egicoccus sp. AB-alg6-2]|uniref:hypothetical protein n=1 Tax=Egicoccus sp. AB-alg6-2 TaxID=3242692 RepID=UPI00359E29DA
MLLTDPVLLTLPLAAIGGYAGWQLGRRLAPFMAVATTAATLGAAFLIHETYAGALQRLLYGVGNSLGEALMTFVPIPLAIAAAATVISAGLQRDELQPVGGRPTIPRNTRG